VRSKGVIIVHWKDINNILLKHVNSKYKHGECNIKYEELKFMSVSGEQFYSYRKYMCVSGESFVVIERIVRNHK